MTLFEFTRTLPYVPSTNFPFKLAIDPGVKTNGFALWDSMSGKIELRAVEAPPEIKPTKMYFPNLIAYIRESQKLMLEGVVPKAGEVHVVIEFCHIGGQFSTGLCVDITSYMELLFGIPNVTKVTLIQNRVPEFFLKKRKLTNTEVGIYAREVFGDMLPTKKVPIHAYDAVLFLLYSEYELLKPHLKIPVRVPEPKKESLIWKV